MNKTQNGWFDITDNGYSQITVKIGGKTVPLRFTVSQQERLVDFQKKQKSDIEAADNENSENFLFRRASDDLECCMIALNPLPNQVDFTREDIENNLDIDQIRLLSTIWISRKVLNPSVTTMAKEVEIAEARAHASGN